MEIAEGVMTAVGLLKIVPEMFDDSKVIWKKLSPPEKLARGRIREGVSGNDYYSDTYKFKISVPPDGSWQFWKPTPQFLSSFLGGLLLLPTRDMPIVILSKQTIKLFRPTVVVMIEDVGSFASISEIVSFLKNFYREQDWQVRDEDTHIYESVNSGILIAGCPYGKATMLQVSKIYLYEGRVYSIVAGYVPISEESTALFGGLQEIMNSFQFIK